MSSKTNNQEISDRLSGAPEWMAAGLPQWKGLKKRRGLLKFPGTVYFSIGPVISTKEKTIEEINNSAQTWIQNEISVIDEL